MSIIQHKRSATAGHIPSSLLAGELAINEANSYLFYLDNTVVTRKALAEPRRLVSRGTIISAASFTLDLTAANVGLMRGFDIYLSDMHPVADGVNVQMRVGDASGLKTGASDYKLANLNSADTDSANAATVDPSAAAAFWGLTKAGGNAAGEGALIYIRLGTNDSSYAYPTKILFMATVHDSATVVHGYFGAGVTAATITLTQCQFSYNVGNIANCNYALLGVP